MFKQINLHADYTIQYVFIVVLFIGPVVGTLLRRASSINKQLTRSKNTYIYA
jgi:hypothetical protein